MDHLIEEVKRIERSATSHWNGRLLGETRMRTETGVSIVAVLRQEGGFDSTGDRLPAVEEEDSHKARRITANHAFGPPSLKVKSFRSGRTS